MTPLIAVRISARSVTCPSARRSAATRISTAGELDIAIAAATAATSGSCPKYELSVKNTSAAAPSASATPISASAGERRSQARSSRVPSSNSTSPSAISANTTSSSSSGLSISPKPPGPSKRPAAA